MALALLEEARNDSGSFAKDLGINDLVWPGVKVTRPAAETIATRAGAKRANHVEWLRHWVMIS